MWGVVTSTTSGGVEWERTEKNEGYNEGVKKSL